MKKAALLFLAVILIAVSCKKNSNKPEPATEPDELGIETPPAAEATTLPQKVVMSNGSGQSETYVISYQSGSKKLDKITKSNGHVEIYHYEEDLISRIDYGTNGSDYKKFDYQNNSLVRETHYTLSDQPVYKTEYTYPSSGKITLVEFEYKNNNWVQSDDPVTLEFDSKGNVIKGKSDALQAGVSYNDTNTPFLNVAGWSKIHFTGGIPLGDNVGVEDIAGRRNNPVKTTVTDGGTSLLDLAFSYEFTDADNAKFPTKITGKQSGQTAFTAEICYTGDCEITGDPNNPDNEGQVNPETETLPATIQMTFGGATKIYTITYQENSKKIDKITRNDGLVETYVYDGNLITKKYRASENSGDYDLYTYDGNARLTKEESYRDGVSKGVTELSYSGTKTVIAGVEGTESMQIELSHDSKGNPVGVELKAGGATAGQVSITYDDTYAPFVNVLGLGKIRYLVAAPLGDNIDYEDILAIGNNPLELTGTVGNDNVKVTYAYEFSDSKNPKFPTKIIGKRKVGTAPEESFEAVITYK